MKLIEYIHKLMAHGQCCFTLDEAEKNLEKSRQSIILSLEHLRARKEIASPAKGFYVIVTPEYQIYECLPPEYFIPYLMEYWECNYYVGLLTAAMYHEASHQAPQVFQVMIDRKKSLLRCGRVKVQFITNRHLIKTPAQTIGTPKSMLNVSTPEGTAMDLLNYPNQSGGLNHIATILAELQEAMKPEKLLALAEASGEVAWKQRLGFLLEVVGAHELAEVLKNHLAQQKRVDYILLVSGFKGFNKNQPRNKTWKIMENTTVESDI